ncbi:phage holin family protein [Holzapfeliella sp. He02]|uniref:Phage holin family protein n=1 Tax=Holzapfeliella saturejae TaxID=3082953 RepID=A0ABU8SI39_9LACO
MNYDNFLPTVWQAFIHLVDQPLFVAFAVVWTFDIFTGLFKSFFKGAKIGADSTTGFKGLKKNVPVLMLILVLYPFFDVLNLDVVGYALTSFYIAFYGLSIIENLDVMGVPFPSFLKERLEKLKADADKGDLSDTDIKLKKDVEPEHVEEPQQTKKDPQETPDESKRAPEPVSAEIKEDK